MLEMKIKIEVADAVISALDKLAAAIDKNALSITVPKDGVLNVNMPAASAEAVTPAPVNPTPAPAQSVPTTTIAAPTSVPTPTPVQMSVAQTAPAPAVPVASAPTYTLDQIATAGAALVNAGKMEQLLALLSKYGIQAITQLKAEQFGAFVTELRGLGAQI